MKFFLFLLLITGVSMQAEQNTINPQILNFCKKVESEFASISSEKREKLDEIANYVHGKLLDGKTAELTFICTHNSRRSHFGQVFGKLAAEYYGLNDVKTYSGGTEVTAFNPRSVAALQRVGFLVQKEGEENPKYTLGMGGNRFIDNMFSKKYDDAINPQKEFCAVLVCSSADAACPYVAGAELRVANPYDDPKLFDDTEKETQKYDERASEMALDLMYVMSKAKNMLVQK